MRRDLGALVVEVEGTSSTLIGSPSTAAGCSSAGVASGAVVEALPGGPLRLLLLKAFGLLWMAFLILLLLVLDANAGAALATGAALSFTASSSGAGVEAEKPLKRPLVLGGEILLLSLLLNSTGAEVLASVGGFLVLALSPWVLGLRTLWLLLRMRPLTWLPAVVGASVVVVVVVVVVTGIVVGADVTGKVVCSSSGISSVVFSSA
jgi:hypothetical protein